MDYFFSFIKENRHSKSGNLYEEFGNELRHTYARVPLESPAPLTSPLHEVLLARHSTKSFSPTQTISKTEIETILQSSFHTDTQKNKPTPSAGGLYPLNLYILLPEDISSLEKGVYYYNTNEHSLDQVGKSVPNLSDKIPERYHPVYIKDASVYICISHIKARNLSEYGTLGYVHAFIEAGHIGQNIYLTSASLGVGCRAIGAPLFDILDDSWVTISGAEHIIYTLALGKTNAQKKENR